MRPCNCAFVYASIFSRRSRLQLQGCGGCAAVRAVGVGLRKGAPVLVIIKKDHSGAVANIKLATDLRKLNAVTEMDAGAIGEMSEIIDKFNGRPYASCCDIASGYYNFLIHPDDRQKLAFVLPFSVGGTAAAWLVVLLRRSSAAAGHAALLQKAPQNGSSAT